MPLRRRLTAPLAAVALAAASLTAGLTAAGGATGAGAAPDPFAEAVDASSAPGHHWQPEPATYAVHRQVNVPVRMVDGTVLRADIATPADPATKQPAAGPFPVLLTQTPYGKDTAGSLDSAAIGIDPYFVERGYIDVAVDVRGTGSSGGRFDLFDPKQVQDGVALVKWAARLPHADGRVGLHGASYLGIDQMLTAAAVGPHSPLKAIFPIVSANDVYRDTAFMGGIPDAEFDVAYLGGLLPAVNLTNPLVGALTDPKSVLDAARVLLQHARNTLDYNALFLLRTYLGGAQSYDTAYWHAKSPGNVLDRIVANGIPAYLIGGEYDLFQRGEPLNYAGLQNAWAGRPVGGPMTAGQPTTGRYQLLDGPYTHLGASITSSAGLRQLMLEWYDTWLRGADTGMADTPTPLHYYDLGTGHYANTTAYPLTGATPTTYWFSGTRSGTALSQNDGTLAPTRPAVAGADRVLWSPVGASVCDRSADQWLMGAFTLLTAGGHRPVPCFDDDRLGQTGPTALTYTTAPFARARTLAGPIAATLYASANRPETEWVVNVEDVAPDGPSKPLTQGALLGTQRALDAARSWRVGGRLVLPYHPYTRAAARAVPVGAVTRYDVEVFPTYATIAAGHRVRVTVTTTDFPHLLPT
ncbi:MAG TPA: CocE/NonD family hydrolase, partial [Jatrophihabitans sp.]|nr:CocE/NonD family hydrolase [Jatrophihabitans sp.]